MQSNSSSTRPQRPQQVKPAYLTTSSPFTDPKDQVTSHSYNADDSLSGSGYTNEIISTPDVSYTYDPFYPRVTTMVDGIGTTSYTYKAPGTNGAGQVATIDGPLANDVIAYGYDRLGRVIQRMINGSANQVEWTFDALGRVTEEVNLLGTFTILEAIARWSRSMMPLRFPRMTT